MCISRLANNCCMLIVQVGDHGCAVGQMCLSQMAVCWRVHEKAAVPSLWEDSVLLSSDSLSNGLTDAQLLQLLEEEKGFPEFDLRPSHSSCSLPHCKLGGIVLIAS